MLHSFFDTAINMVIVGLSATIIYATLSIIKAKHVNKSASLPSTPGLPILGHALNLGPRNLLQTLRSYSEKLGDIYELYALSTRIVVVRNPSIAKEIMIQRPKVFQRNQNMNDNSVILTGRKSHSLFNSEGDKWSRLRRLTGPAFSHKNLDYKTDQLVSEAVKMVERLRKYENTNESVAMEDEAQNLTLRVISQIALGGEECGDSAYFFGPEFAKDIQDLFNFTLNRMFYPYPRWMWKLSQNYRSELDGIAAASRVDSKCLAVIEQRKQAALAAKHTGTHGNGTMLDILIRHNAEDNTTAPISSEELLDNVKLLYIAGSETTSIGLSWAIYYLAQNPLVCDDIRREVDGYMVDDAADLRQMTNVLTTLKFTHAVFKETLRIASPVSVLGAELVSATEPVTLSNGVVVNPHDRILVDVDSCLHDETVFSEPNTFNPHRWFTDDRDKLSMMESYFLTFGSGRRICPGMGLATVEGTIVLAVLLHYYDFDLACDPKDVQRVLKLTTRCDKLPIYVRTRGSKKAEC